VSSATTAFNVGKNKQGGVPSVLASVAQSGLGSSLSKLDDDLKSALPTAENLNVDFSEQAKLEQELKAEQKNKLWMDFDDFCVCFKSIIVYHKPTSFKFSEKYSDLRVFLSTYIFIIDI
jgi:hypothetical protein